MNPRFQNLRIAGFNGISIGDGLKKSVDEPPASAYPDYVPEKEGARLGRLNRKKRTDRAKRFFYVCMPSFVSYERRWQGSPRACWFFFFHQSTNPVICCSPRLVAGRGLNAKKEAIMPGTTTPQQFPSIAGVLSVDQLFQTAFYNGRAPRSPEYKSGARAALAFRIERRDIDPPHQAGTAAADAYFAGIAEGHALWRAAVAKIGGAA